MGADVSTLGILVVDDNGPFRKDLVAYLTSQPGVKVVGEATNGNDALVLVRTIDPDLVLMDISMPGMDGLEATRQIREQGLPSKVVIVTIHEEETYRHLAEFIRADGFVSKSSIKRDIPKVLERIKTELGKD